MAGRCEHGDEHSGSIKCGEFLDQLRRGEDSHGVSSLAEFVAPSICLCNKSARCLLAFECDLATLR